MNELQTGLLWLAGICVALTGIWAFVEKIRKPFIDVRVRLEVLERKSEDHERESTQVLQRHLEMMQNQEEVNELLLKSTSLLMKHGADKNHTGELAAMANDLDAFVRHKGSAL